ncbi:MAG TPA: hypothetical protein VIV60_30005 [Polyangiaceae bacterium]
MGATTLLATSSTLLCSSCHSGHSSVASVAGGACSVEVPDTDARACELVFGSDVSNVVSFEAKVRGSSQQMGTRLAMAFAAREDKGLTGRVATISSADVGGCAMKLTTSICYDRSGKALNNVTAKLRTAE